MSSLTSAEAIRQLIPPYLADPSREELLRALRKPDPRDVDFFMTGGPDQALQGDGIYGLILRDRSSGKEKRVNGIIISNSCDIDPANDPPAERHLIFAPLIKFGILEKFLRSRLGDEDRIVSQLNNIRRQLDTHHFHLPQNPGIDESVAVLDRMEALSLQDFNELSYRRLFRLSNPGFYYFILKLSLHFCRLWENFDRGPSSTASSSQQSDS